VISIFLVIQNLKKFILSLFVGPSKKLRLSETEFLIAEIEKAKDKIQYAWNRFNYAAPEYVELAVLELQLAETQYGLLNKRYRLLLLEQADDETIVTPSI
jgi:hypothetical protein